VIAYLNNILIYFKTLEEHVQHVIKILKYLKKADIKINSEKSIFHK
jgi:hypothetical protein